MNKANTTAEQVQADLKFLDSMNGLDAQFVFKDGLNATQDLWGFVIKRTNLSNDEGCDFEGVTPDGGLVLGQSKRLGSRPGEADVYVLQKLAEKAPLVVFFITNQDRLQPAADRWVTKLKERQFPEIKFKLIFRSDLERLFREWRSKDPALDLVSYKECFRRRTRESDEIPSRVPNDAMSKTQLLDRLRLDKTTEVVSLIVERYGVEENGRVYFDQSTIAEIEKLVYPLGRDAVGLSDIVKRLKKEFPKSGIHYYWVERLTIESEIVTSPVGGRRIMSPNHAEQLLTRARVLLVRKLVSVARLASTLRVDYAKVQRACASLGVQRAARGMVSESDAKRLEEFVRTDGSHPAAPAAQLEGLVSSREFLKRLPRELVKHWSAARKRADEMTGTLHAGILWVNEGKARVLLDNIADSLKATERARPAPLREDKQRRIRAEIAAASEWHLELVRVAWDEVSTRLRAQEKSDEELSAETVRYLDARFRSWEPIPINEAIRSIGGKMGRAPSASFVLGHAGKETYKKEKVGNLLFVSKSAIDWCAKHYVGDGDNLVSLAGIARETRTKEDGAMGPHTLLQFVKSLKVEVVTDANHYRFVNREDSTRVLSELRKKDLEMRESWVKIVDVQSECGVPRQFVDRLVKDGRILAERWRGTDRVKRRELDKLLPMRAPARPVDHMTVAEVHEALVARKLVWSKRKLRQLALDKHIPSLQTTAGLTIPRAFVQAWIQAGRIPT